MEEQEDGVMSPFVMRAVCVQADLLDEVMAARIGKMEREHGLQLLANRDYLIEDYQKLLKIIAYTYQVLGAHDAAERILDVLGDPEGATEEQIDAMLPYHLGV